MINLKLRMKLGVRFYLFHTFNQLFSTIYFKKRISQCIALMAYWKSIVHLCGGQFLDSLLCLSDLFVFLLYQHHSIVIIVAL